MGLLLPPVFQQEEFAPSVPSTLPGTGGLRHPHPLVLIYQTRGLTVLVVFSPLYGLHLPSFKFETRGVADPQGVLCALRHLGDLLVLLLTFRRAPCLYAITFQAHNFVLFSILPDASHCNYLQRCYITLLSPLYSEDTVSSLVALAICPDSKCWRGCLISLGAVRSSMPGHVMLLLDVRSPLGVAMRRCYGNETPRDGANGQSAHQGMRRCHGYMTPLYLRWLRLHSASGWERHCHGDATLPSTPTPLPHPIKGCQGQQYGITVDNRGELHGEALSCRSFCTLNGSCYHFLHKVSSRSLSWNSLYGKSLGNWVSLPFPHTLHFFYRAIKVF